VNEDRKEIFGAESVAETEHGGKDTETGDKFATGSFEEKKVRPKECKTGKAENGIRVR